MKVIVHGGVSDDSPDLIERQRVLDRAGGAGVTSTKRRLPVGIASTTA